MAFQVNRFANLAGPILQRRSRIVSSGKRSVRPATQSFLLKLEFLGDHRLAATTSATPRLKCRRVEFASSSLHPADLAPTSTSESAAQFERTPTSMGSAQISTSFGVEHLSVTAETQRRREEKG